ncbi:FixH family protein [Chelatococcus sp. SYSU_G07232]|uniref:FixH family protein n=1 Tax=Chelatococcus albus TaxID=3047466 RepID=A0ABT7AF75_9HYPH|nr:FixH family protein [Chelatococcus sp. SYSU_G07232]MDJ1158027.1 FixH family protein [Chelatococcus sp. SYSU_G07232]
MPPSASLANDNRRPREITGRMVLMCLLAFFGVILVANVFLVRVAVSTFGGVETDSAYKAGLAFSRELAAARAQDARRWQIGAAFGARDASGERPLTVDLRDAKGMPLAGHAVTARLSHPTDARLDHAIALEEEALGMFRGQTSAAPGQWDLVIEAVRGGERSFRSKSRVTLR